MAIKQGREYRALQDFSLVPRDEGSKEYRVRGTAIVFNSPTVLWECDGVEYKEIIDRQAFDECDMSDVIFKYNHGGKVVARLRNKTLTLTIDERGLHMEADLSRSFFADSSYMLSFSVLCSCVCSRLISPSVSSWHKQDNTLMHQSPGHIQRRTPYNF